MDEQSLLSALDAIANGEIAISSTLRAQVASAAQRVCAKIETPWEKVSRMVFIDGPTTAALKIATDLNLFRQLYKSSQTLQDLSNNTSAATNIIERILYQLEALALIYREGKHFRLTDAGKEFVTDRGLSDALYLLFDQFGPMYASIPRYLADHDYRIVTDGSIWKATTQAIEEFYPWLSSHPDYGTKFAATMGGYTSSRPSWATLYHDAVEKTSDIRQSWIQYRPLVVDIGGGTGQGLQAFLALHPVSTPGALVLQDQEAVINSLGGAIGPVIHPMVHDFLQPQPVKGARLYTLNNVLMDWSDDNATLILKNLCQAAERGYSQILVCEAVLGEHPYAAAMSICIMGFFGSGMRSRAAWASLASSAGLRIDRVISAPHVIESVIVLSVV